MAARKWKAVVSLSTVCLAALLCAPGCKFIENAGDTMATATSGTAVSGVFSGVARAAESMRDYSPAEEHYIGRAVAAEILGKYEVSSNQALQDYVNLVGQAVLAAPEARRTLKGYHFIVVQGDALQAVSTPGGFVFLTEGAVKRAKDEDELASVLAHEVAHVTLNHGIKSIKAATRKQSFLLLAQGAGQVAAQRAGSNQKQLVELTAVFGNAIGDITSNLLVKGYDRSTELEADKMATTLLQSSGYARAALASFLRGVQKEGAGGKGGWTDTHPSPDDRIQALADLATGSSPGRPVRQQRFSKVLGGG
jgi:predicted Zn-dependent protease